MKDLDICKRIAEIEGITYEIRKRQERVIELYDRTRVGKRVTLMREFNPLISDSLCYRLMIKYKVLQEGTGNDTFRAVICNWKSKPEYFRGAGDTLNRAIYLVIIEAHK